MATKHISVEIEGAKDIFFALNRTAHMRSHKVRELVDDIAHYALYWMRVYAPIGETSYLIRHLDKSPLTWRPGGAGGGGTWEVITGIKRGSSMHPVYVHEGTGIYGPSKRLITSKLIRRYQTASQVSAAQLRRRDAKPDNKRGVMTFQKQGEPRRFRPYTRGQAPQPYVRLAYTQARVYAASRTSAFFSSS